MQNFRMRQAIDLVTGFLLNGPAGAQLAELLESQSEEYRQSAMQKIEEHNEQA